MRSFWLRLLNYFLPIDLVASPDLNRRARLLVGFGLQGGIFGLLFSIFYAVIGHYWGALVVVVCSAGLASIPLLLKLGLPLNRAAELVMTILLTGFTALCALEGGIHGHAIAWLVSIPLCAILLSDVRSGYLWCGACLVVTVLFVVLDLSGYHLPKRYPPQWASAVDAIGYLALIAFMFLLGVLFEKSRRRAFRQMEKSFNELAAANQKLIDLNHEKSEFLSIAAHDLKNPLGGVVGYAEMIRDHYAHDPVETKSCAQEIVKVAQHMRALVGNLLDVHALEQGRMNLHPQPVDLNALVRDVVHRNDVNAHRKSIEIKLELEGSTLTANADEDALEQILDNLLSNSIKFSPPHKTVTVRTQADLVGCVCEISDHGPGLNAEDKKKLFTKFAKMSAKPTGDETSNGLGLSIVKRLAEGMGGEVYCRSELGKGATFGLRLKRA